MDGIIPIGVEKHVFPCNRLYHGLDMSGIGIEEYYDQTIEIDYSNAKIFVESVRFPLATRGGYATLHLYEEILVLSEKSGLTIYTKEKLPEICDLIKFIAGMDFDFHPRKTAVLFDEAVRALPFTLNDECVDIGITLDLVKPVEEMHIVLQHLFRRVGDFVAHNFGLPTWKRNQYMDFLRIGKEYKTSCWDVLKWNDDNLMRLWEYTSHETLIRRAGMSLLSAIDIHPRYAESVLTCLRDSDYHSLQWILHFNEKLKRSQRQHRYYRSYTVIPKGAICEYRNGFKRVVQAGGQTTFRKCQQEVTDSFNSSSFTELVAKYFDIGKADLLPGAAHISTLLSSLISFYCNGGLAAAATCATAALSLSLFICRVKKVEPNVAVIKQFSEELFSTNLPKIFKLTHLEKNRKEREKETKMVRERQALGLPRVMSLCGAFVLVITANKLIDYIPSSKEFVASTARLTLLYKHGIPVLSDAADFIQENLFGIQSPKSTHTQDAMDLIADVEKLLAIFPDQTMKNKLYEMDFHALKKKLEAEMLTWNKNEPMFDLLKTKHTAMIKHIETIRAAFHAKKIRQVPVVIFFTGPKGIGKTTMKDALASAIADEVYGREDAVRAIEPDAKYYPEMAGEPIWTVQECFRNRDSSEDAFIRDFTSIVSPAPFNLSGAFAKDQICTAEVILVDTNLAPSKIQTKLTQIVEPDSIEAFLDRIIFVQSEWGSNQADMLLPRESRGYKADFSHLMNTVVRYQHNVFAQVSPAHFNADFAEERDRFIRDPACGLQDPSYKIFTQYEFKYQDIKNMLLYQLNLMRNNFARTLEIQRNPQSVHHMVVHLYGPSGCGKTSGLLASIIDGLKTRVYTQKNYFTYEEAKGRKLQTPSIIICDDVLKIPMSEEAEREYFDFYNELPNGCLIIHISNFSMGARRRTLRMSDIGLPWVSKYYKGKLNFPGSYRRFGLHGNFYHDQDYVDVENAWFYPASGSGVVMEDGNVSSQLFTRRMLAAWGNYLDTGFEFQIVKADTPKLDGGCAFSLQTPSLSALREDLSADRIRYTGLGLTSTKISASKTLVATLPTATFTNVPQGTPLEIAEYYARALRAGGVKGNMSLDIEDLGFVEIIDQKIYTNITIPDFIDVVKVDDDKVTYNGEPVSVEDMLQLCLVNCVSTFKKFPDVSPMARSRILHCLYKHHENELKQFVYTREIDPEFKLRQRSIAEEFLAKVPWIIGIGALTFGLLCLFKSMRPTLTIEEAESKAAAFDAGYLEMTPQMSEDLNFQHALRMRMAQGKRNKNRNGKNKGGINDTESGQVKKALEQAGITLYPGWSTRYYEIRDNDMSDYHSKSVQDFDEELTRKCIQAFRMTQRFHPSEDTNSIDMFARNTLGENIISINGSVYGVGVCGRFAVAPRHVLDETSVLQVRDMRGCMMDHRLPMQYKSFNAQVKQKFPGRDVIIIEITDKTFPPFKDIRNKFVTRETIHDISYINCLLPNSTMGYDTVRGIRWRFVDSLEYIGETLPESKDWMDVYIDTEVHKFRPGDCGLPYFAAHRGAAQVLGLHTSSAELGFNAVSSVYVEDVQGLMGDGNIEMRPEKPMLAPVRKVQNSSPYTRAAIKMLTMPTPETKPIFPLEGPCIRKIVDLPFDSSREPAANYVKRKEYDFVVKHFGPPQKLPIVFKKGATPEQLASLAKSARGPSGLMENVKPLENLKPLSLEPRACANAIRVVSEALAEYLPYMRYATADEVINGINAQTANSQGVSFPSLNFTSSAGMFASNLLNKPTKGDFFTTMMDGSRKFKDDEATRSMLDLFYLNLDEAKQGKRISHVFTTTVKLECLKPHKNHIGRVFESPNIEFTLLERAVLGIFLGSQSVARPDHFCAVGMDDTNGWHERFTLHRALPYHGAVDFKKWDKSLPFELCEIFTNALQLCCADDPILQEWSRTASVVISTIFSSNRAIGNTIYEVHGSMASGSQGTAVLNCWMNFIADLLFLHTILGDFSFHQLKQSFKPSYYGDDKYVSWDEYLDQAGYNMVAFKEWCERELLMRVDSDSKDGVLVPRSRDFTTFSFLSRVSFLQGNVVCNRMNMAGITTQLYFTKRSLNNPASFEVAMDNVAQELCRHPTAEFDKLLALRAELVRKHPQFYPSNIPLVPRQEQFTQYFLACKNFNLKHVVNDKRSNRFKQSLTMNSMKPAISKKTEGMPLGKFMADERSAAHISGGNSHMVVMNEEPVVNELTLPPSMSMNNETMVDDNNMSTTVLMHDVPPTSSTPDRFRADIWTSYFAGWSEISSQTLSAATPLNFQIFNYTSDPGDPDFPSGNDAMALLRTLLVSHDFYVADFILKIKVVSRIGTKGRLIFAMLPIDFNLAGANPVAVIKASYPYIEVSCDGDSTYAIRMVNITNLGMASSRGRNGVISKPVRIVGYVSQPFEVTFNEEPPSVTVATEMGFGQDFDMSTPLTSLPALLTPVTATQSQSLRPQQTKGTFVGNNVDLRVGSRALPQVDLTQNLTRKERLAELGKLMATSVNAGDCVRAFPITNGTFPLYFRGDSKVFSNLFLFGPATDETFTSYLSRVLTSKGAGECYVIADTTGERALPIAYTTESVKGLIDAFQPVNLITVTQAQSEFKWLGLAFSTPNAGGVFLWPVSTDAEDVAFTGGKWTYGIGCTYNPDGDEITQHGPPFLAYSPKPIDNIPEFYSAPSPTGTPSIPLSVTTPALVESGSNTPFTVTQVIQSSPSDSLYPSLTLTDVALATSASIGYGTLPNEANYVLLDYLLNAEHGPGLAVCDLVDGNGLLVAHVALDLEYGLLINAERNFVSRRIGGPLYATVPSTSNQLLPTNVEHWDSYVVSTGLKNVVPRIIRQKQSAGMAAAQGASSAIGGIFDAIGGYFNRTWQEKMMDKTFEQQLKIMREQYGFDLEKYAAQHGYTMEEMQQQLSNNLALGNQAYESNSAMSKQAYHQRMQEKTLMDPSILGSNNLGNALRREAIGMETRDKFTPGPQLSNFGLTKTSRNSIGQTNPFRKLPTTSVGTQTNHAFPQTFTGKRQNQILNKGTSNRVLPGIETFYSNHNAFARALNNSAQRTNLSTKQPAIEMKTFKDRNVVLKNNPTMTTSFC